METLYFTPVEWDELHQCYYPLGDTTTQLNEALDYPGPWDAVGVYHQGLEGFEHIVDIVPVGLDNLYETSNEAGSFTAEIRDELSHRLRELGEDLAWEGGVR